MTIKHKQALPSLLLPLLSTTVWAAEDTQRQLEALQLQLEQTTQAIESLMSQSSGQTSALHIGGYGELHYNNLDSGNEMDFHRFVLFFSKDFSDRIHFFSEVELEHSLAGEGKPGEVELEQAAVRFDLTDHHSVTGGLFLMPAGILNETHEPPTFYGVERNPVEKNIVPTTWWEGGLLASGELGTALHYDVAVTSGLNVDTAGGNAYKIRNGRQKVAEAVAEDLAYTARLRWNGVAGTSLGLTLQRQADITQGVENVSAELIEAHAAIQKGPFGLRALYASWDLDSANAEAIGRNEQTGWYIEPSFKLSSKWGVFARYNEWDNEAGDSIESAQKQSDFGINYWPHPDVVIKADIQNQSGTVDDDGYNLGIGYQF